MPELGSFDRQALCGGHDPHVDDLISERSYFGLEPEGIYVYGTFRTPDGAMHTPARRLPFGGSKADTGAGADRQALGRRLALQTTREGTDGHQHLDLQALKGSASAASMRIDRRGSTALFTSDPADPGAAMRIEVSATEIHWVEEGILDLQGRRVGSGLQWYLPGRDTAMFYTSQIFEVEGRVYGESVSGFVPFDPVYMAPGAVLYTQKDVLQGEKLCTSWYTWGTRWDDGSVEVGHTLTGHGRFGLCVATNATDLTVRTTDVSAAFTWADDGYHVRHVDYVVDGEGWEFVADPHGWQPDLGPVPNPQQEGLMRRVGDTRTPVHWSSWGEANIAYLAPFQAADNHATDS